MKKLLLIIMLAMSVSYSKPSDDVEYISSLLTNCANRNVLKYITLLTNIAQEELSDNSIALYAQYMKNNCRKELVPINSILEKYDEQGTAIILAGAIGMQYDNIANYFKKESKKYVETIKYLLGN